MKIKLSFAWLALCVAVSSYAEDDLDRVLFDPSKKNLRTDAALIVVDGKIVYERYGNGYGPDNKHLSWSTAKATAGILIGIAADKGYLSLNDRVEKWIPEYRSDGTILDFLRMSSNLEFLEDYDGVPVQADVVRMLYLDGPKKGFSSYVTNLPLRRDSRAGDHYYYSSGDTNVLMEVLKRATGNQYESFPWDEYFNKLGIKDATLERDRAGTFVGSSYMYLKARDFAKIGELVANKGFYAGQRIIPEEYFRLMNTISPGIARPLPGEPTHYAYSVQLRTNQPIVSRGLPSEVPELPVDTLMVYGHQGQVLIMIPSAKTVLLRLATDKGWPLDDTAYLLASRKYLVDRGYPAWELQSRENASIAGEAEQREESKPKKKIRDLLAYGRVPKLLRSLAAKEMCSCLYVAQRPFKACKKDLRTQIPFNPVYIVNRKKKIVRTTLVVEAWSKAKFMGERFGCTLY